jgi:hypothetical protein
MLCSYYPSDENEQLEFKEFYLKIKPSVIFTESELSNIVLKGLWHDKLNDLININIKSYLKYYIPKYTSCFLNSRINGQLIFGINDESEITGIPYKGEINPVELNCYVKQKISKYIRGISDINNITVSVKKLEVDLKIINNNITTIIYTMKQRLQKYKKIMSEYKKKKKKWIKEMSKYSTRFYNIFNIPESRKNLLHFCKERKANSNIIKLLESTDEIPVELNKIFYKRFKDINDIVHWAGEFKDYNIDRLQKIKPIKGEMPKLLSYSMILSKINEMSLSFYKNNENINFYTITINILKKETKNIVEFRLPGSNNWYSRSRISLPEGPGCI